MILGLHGSVLRGFEAALGEALALGLSALQMLPYRRHSEPSEAEFEAFRLGRERGRVSRLVVHSRFVPSLASKDAERRARSVALLARELELAGRWGAEAYILHAGAYSPDSSLAEGIRRLGESIREAAERARSRVSILVENVPGGGRRIGGRLEELAEILEAGRGAALGACLDTAHAHAAGYDLSSAEGMLKFLARAHRLLGAERVRAFHLNDTRAHLGSHLEHHAHWGEGRLGGEGLKALLDREEYAGALGILETPKEPGGDRRNLDYLRRLGAGS